MRNPLKPEVVPYAIRAAVALVCFAAYAFFGQDLSEANVGEVVNVVAALLLGKELLPQAGAKPE